LRELLKSSEFKNSNDEEMVELLMGKIANVAQFDQPEEISGCFEV
jgi:hypothetical protein